MRAILKVSLCVLVVTITVQLQAMAQSKSLTNTSQSPYAKLQSVDMGNVKWTNGFWAERFKACRDSMIPHMWSVYTDAKTGHATQNFEIAAGLDTGEHVGPPFQDGDFYKLMEAMTAMYAETKDKKLDEVLDKTIALIGKAQRADGYIHTPTLIDERKNPAKAKAFEDRLNFETYNLGHLMTAACIHYRVTGKRNFLEIAIKATDYLYRFYKTASPELARNAICPSHYMGVVEMYRTTRDPKYLELAKSLIDIRGLMKEGTDDNQDRVPFRQQTAAIGHAVRANYLYAGAADVYAETGDTTLTHTLNLVWNDVVNRKMYITGGCGALYDGVSPDGTSYLLKDVQQVHQAYGRDYQLPNFTSHNETCASVGNVLWNWRMLQLTGNAKYADVMELTLYNGMLSGISLSGTKYLYTNPLSVSDEMPYQQRWSKDRVGYIGYSNCCPPNVIRTIAELNNYVYSVSDKGLYLNLYGGNTLSTKLKSGSEIKLTEQTDYPWNGAIKLILDKAPQEAFSMFFRIPGWSDGATLTVNGKPTNINLTPGQYAEINGKWKTGDVIELNIPMPINMVEANPLVEETRNQIAVKRGPIVYCIESAGIPKGEKVFNLSLSSKVSLSTQKITIDNANIIALTGKAELEDSNWKNKLYRNINTKQLGTTNIQLIPYFAWGNRGHVEMETWIPFSR
ncbi:hypothetical protein BDD43_4553 [Mucilaginibacter gracilis]|uniref:DUF1680 family protein n=1 Tax=Mucilaginibacter gracilis TaxID=423350 RepID=A0A495J8F6_9SPHI|nr:glycoside hydrolase family 127 protein [Mucilaginibacter gracilis]RKR84319.1 hypothetical protein BDD43_4553 [Mucilaginibacter gracilis]